MSADTEPNGELQSDASVPEEEGLNKLKTEVANLDRGAWLSAFLVYGGIASVFLWNWLGIGETELQVVVRVIPASDSIVRVPDSAGAPEDSTVSVGPWQVQGRVIYEGVFPEGASVWAIARGANGHEFAPQPGETDASGAFDLGPIPADFGKGGATVTVSARARIPTSEDDSITREGQAVVGLGGGAGGTTALPAALMSIVGLFFASILIGLWPWPEKWSWLTAKYVVVVALAFTITCTVLYQLGLSLIRVEEITAGLSEGQPLRLGFASIFRGSYVDGFPEDWIFSLTEKATVPVAGDGTRQLVQGFGAPMWGLLLSVFGASLFTVWLIVNGIKEDFRALTSQRAKERVRLVVVHEFYVIFAPFGAILVYQAMVAGGMAEEPVTVALVLLASGVGLNVILNQALARFSSVFTGNSGEETPTGSAGANGSS